MFLPARWGFPSGDLGQAQRRHRLRRLNRPEMEFAAAAALAHRRPFEEVADRVAQARAVHRLRRAEVHEALRPHVLRHAMKGVAEAVHHAVRLAAEGGAGADLAEVAGALAV